MKAYEMMGISLLSLSSMIGCDNTNPPVEQKQDETKLEESVVESGRAVIVDEKGVETEFKYTRPKLTEKEISGIVLSEPVQKYPDPEVYQCKGFCAYFFLQTKEEGVKAIALNIDQLPTEKINQLIKPGTDMTIKVHEYEGQDFYFIFPTAIKTKQSGEEQK